MNLENKCEHTFTITGVYLAKEEEKEEVLNGKQKRSQRRKTDLKLKGKRKYGY